MKAAYLILATALALGAAALAEPGSPTRNPDGNDATQSGRSGRTAETDRTDDVATREASGQVTTTVRNGDNLASVTQSGDPGRVVRRVEAKPGYTKVEQRSGNSRSVIVQSNDPAGMPLDKVPPALRDLLNR
ncbi:MAG: hypothetical protein M3347_08125 [Armatimonadota bacterium]|nr:hypothetical protein [Armatimonadota bacterium]